MKYKVCTVYSGYGEFGIEDVKEIDVNMSLEEVTKQLNIETTVELEESISIEFLDHWSVKDGAGFIAAGEEHFKVVLPEGHVWFDKVCRDYDMPEDMWTEWEKFCLSVK